MCTKSCERDRTAATATPVDRILSAGSVYGAPNCWPIKSLQNHVFESGLRYHHYTTGNQHRTRGRNLVPLKWSHYPWDETKRISSQSERHLATGKGAASIDPRRWQAENVTVQLHKLVSRLLVPVRYRTLLRPCQYQCRVRCSTPPTGML